MSGYSINPSNLVSPSDFVNKEPSEASIQAKVTGDGELHKINQISNFSVLYDTTRPFVFKYMPSSNQTIKMLYIIQAEDFNDSGNYFNLTKILVQDIDPGNPSVFFVDPSNICNDYIVTTLPEAYGGVAQKVNNIRSFRIIFTGAQLNSDGTLDYNDNTEAWTKGYRFWGIDAATQHEETFAKSQAQWLGENHWSQGAILPAMPRLFPQTNMPFNTFRCTDEHGFLEYAIGPATGTFNMHWKIVQTNGITSNFLYVANIQNRDLYMVPMGIPDLTQFVTDQGGNASSMGLSLNPDNVTVDYIEFKITRTTNVSFNVTNNPSRRWTYRNCNCNNKGVTIYWKNRKGGVDSYKFMGDFEEKLTTTYNTFQRALGMRRQSAELSNSFPFTKGRDNTFNQMSLGRGKINIEGNMKFTVFSQHLPKETCTWLSEIYTSPRVWCMSDKFTGIFMTGEMRDGAFGANPVLPRQSVIVTTAEVITNPKKRDVAQIKLEFVKSNDIVAQRQ